jgi:GNAT superfamily N-acetyltransferase
MLIKQCTTENEIISTFPVMQSLRQKLSNEQEYLVLVQSLISTERFHLVAVFNDDNGCLAVAGYRIKRCLHGYGKLEMYVDDLVTDLSQRSKGFGKILLDWLKAESVKLGCATLILDSGTHRIDAHRFYIREGLEVTSLHFVLTNW